MDITMLQKTAIDLSTTQSELFAFADRLARAQEQDNASHETAPAAELKELCGQLRAEIQSLSFRIGSLDDANKADSKAIPSRYAGLTIDEYEFNPWDYDKHIGELRVCCCEDGSIYVLLQIGRAHV